MPKYRLLTHEELMEFEKEFIDFLVVNGITAPDWQALKEEKPKEAVKVIASFSDVIFEGSMRKIKFLELRKTREVRCYQCLDKKMILVAMQADPDLDIDFTSQEGLMQAMTNPPKGLQVFTSEKEYEGVREEELFLMTRQGCLVSDGKLFKALSMALVS
ncbi:MAG: hypothetical protein CL840_13145 [Crocinitomicaceae bacterium]|nr:hypothetical protein [Crocinitomicaceae bacterium]|tara:strand:- start:1599 stop:2075 length:477 start_codon:yes stop_codon:yes gene_type:complete